MDWLVDLLVYSFARPLLRAVLSAFGYNLDWDPKDGHQNRGWRLVFSAFFCCALSAIVFAALIWLMWIASG